MTLAELLFGVGTLPTGRRKSALADTLNGLLPLFDGRVLAFDTQATRCCAELAVKAWSAGQGFPAPDGYIAAIFKARGFAVATRVGAAFQAASLDVINPWAAPQ